MKVKTLLRSSKSWIKGAYARNKYRHKVEPTAENACRWCLAGAISRCYEDENDKDIAFKRLGDIIAKKKTGSKLSPYDSGYSEVVNFNDSDTTTFKDVKEVLKEANI